MNDVAFREIAFASPEFDQECLLREAVLRRPLGLSLFDEDLAAEREQMHFGLFDRSANLVACVIAAPQSSHLVKLRQMAVAPTCGKKGYGSAILRFVENHLEAQGFRHVYLHARSTAVAFYKKQGYVERGFPFAELGIAHVCMEKYLSQSE